MDDKTVKELKYEAYIVFSENGEEYTMEYIEELLKIKEKEKQNEIK